MEKKILGWRLKKDCEKYRDAANKIIDSILGYKVTGCDFVDHSPSYYILQKAGVLDLWFEKVLEEVPKFKVGNYVRVATCQEFSCNGDDKMCNNTLFYRVGKIGVLTKMSEDGRWCYIDNEHLGITVNQIAAATSEEIAAAQKITICGKEVLFDIDFGGENFIKINGQAYLKKELLTLQLLMNRGQIKSLNVGCNGQEQVDLKLIEKILSKL